MKKIALWAGIATFVFTGIAQADAIQSESPRGAVGRRRITRCGSTLHAAAPRRFHDYRGSLPRHDPPALGLTARLTATLDCERGAARCSSARVPRIRSSTDHPPEKIESWRRRKPRQLRGVVNQPDVGSNPV